MNREFLEDLCKCYALSAGWTVRLYHAGQKLCTHTAFSLDPDPFLFYEEEMFSDPHSAGIYTTDLFQLYGFLHLDEGYCIAIGPSCILTDDEARLENLMFLLGLPKDSREEYRRKLSCMPNVNVERMAFSLSFLSAAICQKPLSPENIYVKAGADFLSVPSKERGPEESLRAANDKEHRFWVEKSFSFENVMMFYITAGRTESLREILHSMPDLVRAGKMAKDTLRQLKNTGICCATLASRAAIKGGLESQTAFRISDLYIQRFEILRDAASIQNLTTEMLLDYADRVMRLHYPGSASPLFQECARYVSRNLFSVIKVEEMAKNLGIARPYLCSRFHQSAGITLSRFILTEKVLEAQRLLKYSDKSISDIAAHLAFSSQSHFQTSFKKITGKTPLEFRLSDS